MPRLLRDESLPRQLSALLPGHDVRTVARMRWSGLRSGALLARAEDEFDVLVTMDRSLRFQQSIEGRRIALLVLRAKSNDLADLEPLVPGILAALESITPGTVTTVPAVSIQGG